jgi:hypothetical protein
MRAAKSTPKPTASPTQSPTPQVSHAPCAIPSGYKAPLEGKLVVSNAFGELQMSNNVRYAQQGVDLTTRKGDLVRATVSGRIKYFIDPVYGKSALITQPDNAQTFYGNLENPGEGKLPKPRKIKTGEVLGRVDGKSFHYEITNTLGRAAGDAAQMNPCGDGDGATGTISIVPDTGGVGVNVAFTAFSLDGTPLPSPSPGVPITPATLTVAHIVQSAGHAWTFSTAEYGPNQGSFYIVLCGNVVFQTGSARYSALLPYPSTGPVTLPQLVFFRDPGTQGDLTQSLPGMYPAACPAPAPPYGGGDNIVFNAIGQSWLGYWVNAAAIGTMTMTSANAAVATVSPNPAPIVVSATYPPVAGTYYAINAAGIGTTQITNVNTVTGETPAPIVVTVRATPSPAPNPTPMLNVVPTASPTPKSTTTPTTSPTPA